MQRPNPITIIGVESGNGHPFFFKILDGMGGPLISGWSNTPYSTLDTPYSVIFKVLAPH